MTASKRQNRSHTPPAAVISTARSRHVLPLRSPLRAAPSPAGGGNGVRVDERKGPTNPQHLLVGRADPGAPGSNAHVFPQFRANSQAPPCREGACPFRQGMPRRPPTLGESASVQRIRPGFSMSDRVLRGKGKPFPYNETAADSPGVAACLWRCCGPSGTPAPTMKCCGFAAGGDLSLVLLRDRPRAGRRSLQSAAFMCRWGQCEEQDLRTFHVRLCGMDV